MIEMHLCTLGGGRGADAQYIPLCLHDYMICLFAVQEIRVLSDQLDFLSEQETQGEMQK